MHSLIGIIALVAHMLAQPRGDVTPRRWALLLADSTYRVSLDTASIARRSDGSYAVLYETWHVRGETDAGLTFNREEVRSLLRCDPLGFRTLQVSLFLNHGKPLRVQPGDGASSHSPWRTPGRGSVDLSVMRRACAVIKPTRVPKG
jgi:hypothetical protein